MIRRLFDIAFFFVAYVAIVIGGAMTAPDADPANAISMLIGGSP